MGRACQVEGTVCAKARVTKIHRMGMGGIAFMGMWPGQSSRTPMLRKAPHHI